MDEKYIQELYSQLGGQNKFGDFNSFKNLIKTDKSYQKAFHDSFGDKTLGDFNEFSGLVSSSNQKKKESSQPTSQEDQSVSSAQQKKQLISAATGQQPNQQASATSDGEPKIGTFTGFTPEQQKSMKTPEPGYMAPKENKELENLKPYIKKTQLKKELGETKVTPENQEAIYEKINEVDRLEAQTKQIEKERLDRIEQDFVKSKDSEYAEAEADKRLNDLLSNTGVWNNVKSTAKDLYNTALSSLSKSSPLSAGLANLTVNTDPLAEEKKQIISQAAKEKVDLSGNEVLEKAKQLFKDKQIDNIETDRVNSFLDNLPEADKEALKQDRYNTSVHLQEENAKNEKAINAYSTIGNKKIEEYKSIENQLKSFKERGVQFPEDLYNKYTSLSSEIKNISENIQKRQDLLIKNNKDLGTVNQEFDLLKRQYGDVENFMLKTGIAARELGIGIVSGLDYLGSQTSPYAKAASIGLQSKLMDINKGLEEERENLRKSVESVESVEGFVNYASDVVANQIPSLVATSTGVGGLGVIGISGAGQKYTEMNQEVLEGKASYNPEQMALAPLFYGSAEVVSEIPTLSILKKGGRVLDAVAKNQAELLTKTAIQKGKDFAKDFAGDQIKEGAGEQFTNFAQNVNDRFLLGKKDVGLLDNTGTVFKDTFLLTGMLKAAPHLAGLAIKPFQSNTDLNILDENSRKILQFSRSLNTLDLSEDERSVIQKQIDKATSDNSKIIANTIDRIANMPDEAYLKVSELNKNAAQIKNDARVVNDGNLPNKDTILKDLENQYRDVQIERSDLINAKYDKVTVPTEVTTPVVEEIKTIEKVKPTELAKEYIDSIEKVKSESPDVFWSVDRPFQKEDGTIDEVQLNKAAEDGRIIKTDAGFGVVGEDGDIKGVFKADLKSTEKTGDKVIQEAVKVGGTKLDNFALPNLMKIYERNGFREVSRLPFNEEYAPEGWNKEKNGTPDVVAMVYDPEAKLQIEKKDFTDYDEAIKYRDSFLENKAPIRDSFLENKAPIIEIDAELEAITKLFDESEQGVKVTDSNIENGKKAIEGIVPGVEFIVHDTNESMREATGSVNKGEYIMTTDKDGNVKKVIHINKAAADGTTVAHEVFHAVLLDKVLNDADAQELTKRMMKAVAKTASPELKRELDDFARNYEENIRDEEKLAQLIGILAKNYDQLSQPNKTIIKKWLDKLAKMFGLKPFTDNEVIDLLNTIAGKTAKGEAITEKDVKVLSSGVSTYISEPTEIKRFQSKNEEKVKVGDHKLSFVKESDIIDLNSLMKDISDKKQKVWFWVADQLGRGNYFDVKIDGEHYLDAGPSFALDPVNRDKNIIWATGKNEKEITKLIGNSDYIFIISGSPLKSKLFNKSVIDIVAKRVGDFNLFKKEVLESSKIKSINDILSSVNSWNELRDSTKRKDFLLELSNQKEKNTPLKKVLEKYNAIVDLNELRDGFYADNNFDLNDIMLVLKPTEYGGKSKHSTYENDILGDVVGVPDIKVNAFDIMPSEIKDKYKEELSKSMQQQVVAPYGIGVRTIKRSQKSDDKSENFFDKMDAVFPNDHILGGYAATDSKGNLLGRISMSKIDGNTVKINEVVSDKKGQRTGNGSAIMKIVTENADKNNVNLTLTPNLIGDMKVKGFETAKKLEDFYSKFGFTKDKGRATMTRLSETKRSQKDGEKLIDDYVRIAKANKFSDDAIKKFLKAKGFSDTDIDTAMSSRTTGTGRPSVNDIYDQSKKAIEDRKRKMSIKNLAPFLRKSLLDRQAYIKRLINKIDNKSAKKAYDLLVTKAGASALASERFKRAEKKIYGGLSSKEVTMLDKIIYAKRMVAVNESRAKLGMEPYKGMDGYSLEDAKQDLADFKSLLGDNKFNDLNNRATSYFDVFKLNLKKLYDSGRISKETYDSLKDTEYSPIKTIKYIIGDNLSVDEIDTQAKSLGISRKDIMKLSDSNENEVIMDSKWLLAMNISSVEGRAFENNMLREFDRAINDATPEEKKALEDFVLDNPVVGKKTDGSPKYKYDDTKLPVGFVKVSYFNDGNKVDIVIKDEYAKQLLDVKSKNKALETLGALTGTKILRFFATGGNPLFIIGNTAVDFQNIAFFSNVYSKFKPIATVQLARDYTKNFVKKLVVSKEYNKIFNEYINHGGALDYMASDGLRALESMNPIKGATKAAQKGLIAYGRAMAFLGETSEVAFRLSVFEKVKNDSIKEFEKENNRKPNAQELDDIMWKAARESRETMDFSQGGDVAKNIDAVFPYFNAALQGIRRPIDFAKKDPVGFSASVLQYTVMASGLAAGAFAMLIKAVRDDEDDDKKANEKIMEALNSLSEYEKANYHIIFTGNKDKDGEYEYYRVKKLPVLSVISTVAEQLIYKQFFNSQGVDYDVDSEAMMEAVSKSNPLPVTVQEVAAKNPVASGLVSYWANKDTFTGDKIFREPNNKKISPEAEGMFDNKVDQIYKDLAPGFGLSPARTKVMVEKVITSANTNPTIPLMYSAYDGLFNNNDGLGAEVQDAMSSVGEAFGKKLVRHTDKNVIRYKEQDKMELQETVMETDVWKSEQKVYNEIKNIYKDGDKLSTKELIGIVKENFEPMDHKKYFKKYNAYIHNMSIDKSVLDIIFEDVPEVQAMKLNQRYGDNLEGEELKELYKAMNSAGKRVNKKSIYIYNQKYKNRKD